MAFTEYLWKDADEVAAVTEESGKGPIFNFLSSEAVRLNSYVSAGYTEFSPDDNTLYNSMYVVGRSGELLVNYRKTSLFLPDNNWCKPSAENWKTLTMTNTEGVQFKTGMAICKDFILPSAHEHWIKEQVDVILLPTGTPSLLSDKDGNPGAYAGPVAFEQTLAPMNKDWLVLWVNHAGEEVNILEPLEKPTPHEGFN